MAGSFLVDEFGPQSCQMPTIRNGVPANASHPVVLSDLFAPDPQQDHSELPSEPVSGSNAVAVPHREVALLGSPTHASAELERVRNATVRPGPRLDRIPTLAIQALHSLALARMNTVQELVEDAVADLLKKHGRPVTLREALEASVPEVAEGGQRRKTRKKGARTSDG